MTLVGLLIFLVICGRAWSSFSYAKFESPESGRVLYSIKHNTHVLPPEYNIYGLLRGKHDSAKEPSQRAIYFDNYIHIGKKPRTVKNSRKEDDLDLIDQLFRPGKLAPSKSCQGGICSGNNVLWNKLDDSRNTKSQKYRVIFSSEDSSPVLSPKRIKFPDEKGSNSARLVSRSKDLWTNGRRQPVKSTPLQSTLEETSPPMSPAEIKYIRLEKLTLLPFKEVVRGGY